MSENIDLQKFKLAAINTVLWYVRRIRNREKYNNETLFRGLPVNEIDSLLTLPPEELAKYIDHVITMRSSLTKEEHSFDWTTELYKLYSNGKLFVLFPFASTSDGTLQIDTNGLFDIDNFPPYDLWVYYLTGKIGDSTVEEVTDIIAWIPPEFVDIVDMGISACADTSISWVAKPRYQFLEKDIEYRYILDAHKLLV